MRLDCQTTGIPIEFIPKKWRKGKKVLAFGKFQCYTDFNLIILIIRVDWLVHSFYVYYPVLKETG